MKKLFCITLLLAAALPAFALDAKERMEFADGMYVRGLYDMAVEEYLGLLREAAGFEEMDLVLFRIGECYRHLGRKKSADEFYRRLDATFPESPRRPRADLRRAELYLAANQFEEAAGLLESLLARAPPPDIEAPALYYLGYARKKMAARGKELSAAARARVEEPFRRLLKTLPDSPFASYAALDLAEWLREEGRPRQETDALYRQALEQPASDRVAAEAWFQLAESAFAAADYPAAAEAYGKLLEEYPRDRRAPEARLQAAWSSYHVGRLDEALKRVRDGLKTARYGEEEGWWYLQANCQRRGGKAEAAEATYDKLLKKYPNGDYARAAAYEKALLAFQGGDFARAAREAADIPGDAATDEDRNWLLAESYAALKQPEKAREHYRKIVDEFPDGKRAPVAAYRMAALAQDAGDFARAAEAYRFVVDHYPKHEVAPDALFAAAFCRARLKEHKQALKDWNELLSSYPDYHRVEDALYQKALLEFQLEKKASARKSLKRLLNDFPETGWAADAHRLLAVLAEDKGANKEAERELRAGLKCKPSKELADRLRFRLAAVLQKQDKLDEAADLLDTLVGGTRVEMPAALLEWLARYRLEEGDAAAAARVAVELTKRTREPAWQQIAWYLVGRAREKLGHMDQARSAYDKALEQDAHTREGAEAALALGEAVLDKGNFQRAVYCFQKAGELAQDPELIDLRARSYYGLGQTAWARKRWEDAARYFMSVGILFDDPVLTPECLYRAAEAFGKLGRKKDREKTLLELKMRYPDSKWSREITGEGKPKPAETRTKDAP